MMGLGDESGGLRKTPLAVIVHERLPAKDIGKLLYLRAFPLIVVFLLGCVPGDSEERDLLDKEMLMNDIKVGEVVLFKRISSFKDGEVCVLYPYQDSVTPNSHIDADEINKYLTTINYQGRESQWSVVFVKNAQLKQVKIYTIRRSRKMDIANVMQGSSSPLHAPDGPVYDPSSPPVEGGGAGRVRSAKPMIDKPPWESVSGVFEPVSYCADVNQAAFFKYQFRGRNYLVFGRIK